MGHKLKALAVALLCSLVFGVTGFFVTKSSPDRFASKGTIYVTGSKQLVVEGLGALGGGGRDTYLTGLLKSRRLFLLTYKSLGLESDESFWKPSIEDRNIDRAFQLMEEYTSFQNRSGLISISVATGDADLSASIVNEYLMHLEHVILAPKIREKELIQRELDSRVVEMEQLEERLLALQAGHGKPVADGSAILDLKEHSELKQRLTQAQSQIEGVDAALNGPSGLDAKVSLELEEARLMAETEFLANKVEEKETELREMPEILLAVGRMERELELSTLAAKALLTQVEQARFEEIVADKEFEIVDVGEAAIIPVRKRVGFKTVLSLMVGFALGIGLVWLKRELSAGPTGD